MRILFVCTGNTCRSPLAERLARQLYPQHRWESAGVMPTGGMHRLTAQILEERGADAADFFGRFVDDLELAEFDHIVLIGDTAIALAPKPPDRVAVHHWYVDDPFEARGSEAEIYAAYKTCEADLLERITELAEGLG